MTKFHIREWRSDKILATVEIARGTPLYVPDLRGISLENARLNGADLRSANLSGVCLRGARLREAMLESADLSGADLSYTDLTGATLNNTNLNGTIFYPCQIPKRAGTLHGAKFEPGSDAAVEYFADAGRNVASDEDQTRFRGLRKVATHQRVPKCPG
jgi:Pentapeptide repeats (8 copies)